MRDLHPGMSGVRPVSASIIRYPEDGKFRGGLKATGLRPRFVDRLADVGITIPAEVFAPDGGRSNG